jgi:hypothetical protein
MVSRLEVLRIPLFGSVKLVTTQYIYRHVVMNILPPFQIIRHSKNLGESNDLKFDQIYMIR